MKRILQVVAISFLTTIFLWVSMPLAWAASYDVSASVPYPVPTQAATIDPALNNLTVQNAAFVISGTCQVLSPVAIISVWRGGTTVGSQACSSGTYSLQITLIEGSNSLVVKTANISAVYGPDSTPITVTLHTPVITPPPLSNTHNTPGATNLSPADNAAFNNAAKTELSIVPQKPFTVLPASKEVSLTLFIGGGSNPYTVELNWGDGTTETKVVDKPGNYTFTHQYRNSGNYTVKGKVRDVFGAVTEISHSVVVNNPIDVTGNTTKAPPKPKNTLGSWFQHHWVCTTIGVAATGTVVASVATAYWLGQTTAMQTVNSAQVAKARPKAQRKTAKTKLKGKQ